MARPSNLEKMSFAELSQLEGRIARMKLAKQNSERAAVRQKLIDLAKQHGFDIHELLGKGRKGNGKGSVAVRQDSVFLGEDFEVGPGPKYHVYLVPKAPIRASGDLSGQKFVDLGRLRAFKGSQRYAIPADLDLARFQSVVIWCEQFSVLISPADLRRKA